MASANLDLVRSLYAAWSRGEFGSVEWAHPEIEYVIVGGPTPGTWKGVDGMTEGFGDFLSTTDEFRVYADDYRELDGERVLVLVHHSGRGKASGLELAHMRSEGAHLLHIRAGKVMRLVSYLDRERALADLGLTSEA